MTELAFDSFKSTTEGEVSYPQDKIGYPVVSAAGLKRDNLIRVALSGVCSFPFRSAEVETALNEPGTSEERIQKALDNLPAPIIDDLEGSAGYRAFVLKNTLRKLLERLE